jgi:hypothetical protein
MKFKIFDIVTSTFIKTPAMISAIDENTITVIFKCNGKSRKFFISSFLSHSPKIVK